MFEYSRYRLALRNGVATEVQLRGFAVHPAHFSPVMQGYSRIGFTRDFEAFFWIAGKTVLE